MLKTGIQISGLMLILAPKQSSFAESLTGLPTPREVWKDFDPDKGDLKEEVILEQTRDDIYYRESYISAYVLGEEVRVYCKYSVKAGAQNAPGLMDVHGWMGAPNPDKNYANDGWAVMAHDYCGKTGNRPHYTKYPVKLRHGNMDAKEGVRIKSRMPDGKSITDPRQTDDYLWYAIQRRALSYLLAQKEVDPKRIGAKGYSYGGTIMWNLGMDARVKAIVAYFGVGWLEYYRSRGAWMYNRPPKEPDETPGERLYLSAIAPQAHAPYITAASLWLNGTNDHHGGHERGEQTFKMFQPNVPWSFAHQPRGHHDTQDIGHNAKLWLEKHVLGKRVQWPAQAESKIVLDAEGVPELHVSPANPDEVAELKVFYALKNPVSFGRAWRDAKATCQGNTWIGKMPVINVDDYVFGFSNIRYANTIVRSSPFVAAIPSMLGNAKATDKPSTNLSDSTGSWTNAGPVQGKGGIKGFRVLSNRGTLNQQFSDPKWKAPKGARLSFKFYCTQPQELIMAVNNHYQAKLKMTASDDWQEMAPPANHFLNRFNQRPLKDWSATQRIDIKPGPGADITKVVFADFKWTDSKSLQPRPQPKKATTPAQTRTEIPDGPRVYLTRELASRVESFVKVQNDKAWEGGSIRVGGKTYKRGLGVHAESKITFPLDGKYQSFHVVPGPDDAHHGLLEMKVLVDGKEVFASGKTRSKDKILRTPLSIPTKGAKTLTLIVTDGGDGRGGDHASWADAYLLKK